MKLKDLVKLTNRYLAGEQLTYNRLVPFFDEVIDDINNQLNSTFPTFSSLEFDSLESEEAIYYYFPDSYLRTVVAVGAAHKFYEMDEEGMSQDDDFSQKYRANLFYMLRDYIDKVPPYFRATYNGSVPIHEDYTLYRTEPFNFKIWS